jgi:trehalose-phosphatase
MRSMAGNHLPEGFWESVKQARSRLIAMDYDGTLAPFQLRRERALPEPGVVPTLLALAEDSANTVAVISGRPVDELYLLLSAGHAVSLDRIALFGEHGWELCRWGEIRAREVPKWASELLTRAELSAQRAGWSHLLERKRASIVLHTRALDAERARRIEMACQVLWSDLTHPDTLRLDEIDRGLELRVTGRDKGTALLELAAGSSPGTLLLYVGDDETDEDAFRALRGLGIGLRVVHGPCRTAADGTLAGCGEVASWLSRLSMVLGGGRRPPGNGRSA